MGGFLFYYAKIYLYKFTNLKNNLMTIKRKFRVVVLLTAIVSIAMLSFILIGSKEVEIEIQETTLAGEIFKTVVDLNDLTQSYLNHHDDKIVTEWKNQYDNFLGVLNLNREMFESEEERENLQQLDEDSKKIIALFNTLVELNKEPETSAEETLKRNATERQISSEISANLKDMHGRAYELYQEALAEISELQEITKVAVFISIIIFILLTIGTLLFLIKNILDSINKLSSGADIIGKGNFDKRIELKSEDELAQLASSFNKMAESLDDFYGKLEDEVQKRTEELEKTKNSLEQKVQERTIELQQAKSGLESEVKRQTEELTKKLDELEKINKFMVGRELRIHDLKKKIAGMENQNK